MDLLRAADSPGHDGRRCDPGGPHPAISFAHSAGRAEELDVCDIRCSLDGGSRIDVAFRTTMSDRTYAGAAMSTCTTMEQENFVGVNDCVGDWICRGLSRITCTNVF